MQISRNIVNGPKCNNQVLVGIWVIVCVQEPFYHFLQTIRPLRMFKIVFGDSSLYRKQLSLYCRLLLISASADRIGCITRFCSMIGVSIVAFRHLIMSQQRKRKTIAKVC